MIAQTTKKRNSGLDNIEYQYYTESRNNDNRYFRRGGGAVAREKFQTLTEQMFYILLCLTR